MIRTSLSVLLFFMCITICQGQNKKRRSRFKVDTIKLIDTLYINLQEERKPQNIIFLIGDGMGLSQVSTSYLFSDKEPNFSRFTDIGLSKTPSSSHKVTDSAAGATAFSCGIKTYNGAIGVDSTTTRVPNLMELSKDDSISTGMVATSSITHATPASFYAHVPSRNLEDSIALELIDSELDFFIGGGLKFFTDREDGNNLLPRLEEKGYIIDTGFISTNIDTSKKYGSLLAYKGLKARLKGREDILPLATQSAIDYLSTDKDGFFLMVEGSQIDWEGHSRNSEGIIQEVLDFDKAIGVALDFAKKDGNTLVIVTADHETGGYALSPGFTGTGWDYNILHPTFFNRSDRVKSAPHTATMVPVFAYGPGSDSFSGIYENNEIFHKIRAATGW